MRTLEINCIGLHIISMLNVISYRFIAEMVFLIIYVAHEPIAYNVSVIVVQSKLNSSIIVA